MESNNRRMKIGMGILLIGILLVLIGIASAEDFAKAEEIIKNKTLCSELTQDELEILGDYYMEQMHPGELHEIMDERMGGEGSESLRQVHINMGLAFYCGESGAMSSGMMNVMMGRGMMYSGGMMASGGGMMNNYYRNYYGNSNYYLTSVLINLLLIVLIILLIVWLVKISRKKNRR